MTRTDSPELTEVSPELTSGSVVRHQNHGLGTVRSVSGDGVATVFFASPRGSRSFVQPWFEIESVTGASSEMHEAMEVQVPITLIEKRRSMWSIIAYKGTTAQGREIARRERKERVKDACRRIAEHPQTKTALSSKDSGMLIGTLLQRLEKLCPSDMSIGNGAIDGSPIEAALLVVSITDHYASRAIKVRRVSDGNGGYRPAERDLTVAREARREIARDVENRVAWRKHFFSALPLGASRRANSVMLDLVQQMSGDTDHEFRIVVKAITGALEERSARLCTEPLHEVEMEINTYITQKAEAQRQKRRAMIASGSSAGTEATVSSG